MFKSGLDTDIRINLVERASVEFVYLPTLMLVVGMNEGNNDMRRTVQFIAMSVFIGAFGLSFFATARASETPRGAAEKLLGKIGFDAPIVVHVLFSVQLNEDGELAPSNQADAIAFLSKAGILSAVPSPKRAPWWSISVTSGKSSENGITVFAARRKIQNISDRTHWNQGAIKFYAETISYAIVPREGEFDGVKLLSLESSLRLVIYDDPAIGYWKVYNNPQRGTRWSENDALALKHEIEFDGKAYLAAFNNAVVAARNKSFDLIQDRLAKTGVVRVSENDTHVVVSNINKAMYFRGPTLPARWTTMNRFKKYCGTLSIFNAKWHLATVDDVERVLRHPNPHSDVTDFADTPDHRIWGSFSRAGKRSFQIITDSLHPYVDYTFTVTAFQMNQKRHFVIPSINEVTDMVEGKNPKILPFLYQRVGWFKILCVSSLSSTAVAPAVQNLKLSAHSRYRGVREKLLNLGWTALQLRSVTSGSGLPPYPNVMWCSGIGSASCFYGWRKGKKDIEVVGYTEDYENQKINSIKKCDSIRKDSKHTGKAIWKCD